MSSKPSVPAMRTRGSSFPTALVAIPAMNEGERIDACLAALARQRDVDGAPLPDGSFTIIVFANNCSDDTVARATAMAAVSPHPIDVVAERLPPERSNAGGARKRAMDLAAERLIRGDRRDGHILTTDADSLVGPTWVHATRQAFATGADAVAGYIDAHPAEIMRLGAAFIRRSRLEDAYLRAAAEIQALCDPRPHDPWPNHRVSSGASLAVTLTAYLAIGGLPPRAIGEDAALTLALEDAGFKVRHALDVCVSTSCRLDGRARGGAGETMRHRHAVVDAPCDGDLLPALALVRQALVKGRLRRMVEVGRIDDGIWSDHLGLSPGAGRALSDAQASAGFESLWRRVAAASPILRPGPPLQPDDLPRQIARAGMVLRALRRSGVPTPQILPGLLRDPLAA